MGLLEHAGTRWNTLDHVGTRWRAHRIQAVTAVPEMLLESLLATEGVAHEMFDAEPQVSA